MTDAWEARGRWHSWQKVARGGHETVVIPVENMGARTFLASRQKIIAAHVRDWIASAEARHSGT
jgi:hypothetical protein